MKRTLASAVTLSVAATVVASCTYARVTQLGPTYEPLASDASVEIFSAVPAPCAFDEVATLVVFDDFGADGQDLQKRMREEARKLGAHAVIDFKDFPAENRAVSGTAIRYRDPTCAGRP